MFEFQIWLTLVTRSLKHIKDKVTDKVITYYEDKEIDLCHTVKAETKEKATECARVLALKQYPYAMGIKVDYVKIKSTAVVESEMTIKLREAGLLAA